MKPVRRIAIVQRDFNRDGSIERGAFLLARELLALGVDVDVFCKRATREQLDGVAFHDVLPTTRAGRAVEIATFAAAATRLVREARRRYDVVDVNNFAAWRGDVVTVHEVVRAAHRRWPEEGGASFRAARARAAVAPVRHPVVGVTRAIQYRQFHPFAFAGAVVISDSMRDELVREHGVPAERIVVAPIALELTRGDGGASVRESLGLDRSTPLLLFVGDAFRRKGLPAAVEALAALPGAHLAVLGAGRDDERREAEGRARAAGVAERVHFAGRTNPGPYYASADAFVLPTSHDAWGLPVVEAMASGVPVVTTRAAGSSVLLAQCGGGIVLDEATPQSIARAVGDVLAAPGDPSRAREAARQFTPRARAEAVLDGYEQLLASRVRRIGSIPAVQNMNPYQRLLYRHLEFEGIELEDGAQLRLRWLVSSRRRVDALHVHWPESLYRLQRGPAALRPAGSWLKLAGFAVRLGAARALGYRLAWTIHQPLPHELRSRVLDRAGARMLARAAHVLLAHDEATRDRAARVLGARDARRIELVLHGSYIGVYPPGRPRHEVRAELGIPDDAFVFLSFGELRAHKCWRLVIRAFRRLERHDVALVVAGLAKDPSRRAAIAAESAGDPRIRLALRYVPDARVAELFAAADAAVIARDDGGTSGSLVLPLSLGVPVVAADCPAYRALTRGETCGWLFAPGDVESLRSALERAAGDPVEAGLRGHAALAGAEAWRWDVAAARFAELLREAAR